MASVFETFLRMFRASPAPPAPGNLPRVPAGERYYVIGDIHGRLDLFDALIDGIEADDAGCRPANTTVVMLGDLIDRGPDSAGVIRRARDWCGQRRVRILMGNHEEMFLQSFEDIEVLRHFLKHGGRETILSFGIKRKKFNELSLKQLLRQMPRIVPEADRAFLASFEGMVIAGDYAFVHAGIDPGVPLSEQKRADLLWIRERFLRHRGPFEKTIVHGHTIFDKVEYHGHRIGVDTGAFRSGVLSALVLQGETRRVIQSVMTGSAILIRNEG